MATATAALLPALVAMRLAGLAPTGPPEPIGLGGASWPGRAPLCHHHRLSTGSCRTQLIGPQRGRTLGHRTPQMHRELVVLSGTGESRPNAGRYPSCCPIHARRCCRHCGKAARLEWEVRQRPHDDCPTTGAVTVTSGRLQAPPPPPPRSGRLPWHCRPTCSKFGKKHAMRAEISPKTRGGGKSVAMQNHSKQHQTWMNSVPLGSPPLSSVLLARNKLTLRT